MQKSEQTQKERLAAFRREFCGGLTAHFPLIAGGLVAADLLFGFAPPTRWGDIAFLVLFILIVMLLPRLAGRSIRFAASLRTVQKKGLLEELLGDWAAASGHPAYGAVLGERFVFDKSSANFCEYSEIKRILRGPEPDEKRSFKRSWSLLLLGLEGKRRLRLGQCEKEPAVAYSAAQDQLEQALRRRIAGGQG